MARSRPRLPLVRLPAVLVGLIALLGIGAVLIPAVASAQAWMAGSRWKGPKAKDLRCHSEDRVLPAGLFFRDIGWYEQELRSCPAPSVALVAGVHPDEASVEKTLAALNGVALAPGYPWVAHTRYAGFEGDGVAVVLGQFETPEEAGAWLAKHRVSGPTRLLKILGGDAAIDRFEQGSGGKSKVPVPEVTHLLGPDPVKAISRESAEAVEAAFQSAFNRRRGFRANQRAGHKAFDAALAAAKPVCTLQPGDVFIFPTEGTTHQLSHHQWRMVRCGTELAFVPIEATGATAVVWGHRDGRPRITQVTLVECDVATHTTWVLGPKGRRSEPRVAFGSCAP